MPHTITNIPRCLPQILRVPKFWYHLAHSFSRKNIPFDFVRAFWEAEGALSEPKGPFFQENEAQEMTPKLLALAKVCSVLRNIHDVSWHLLERGSELDKRWTFSFLDKNGGHKNKACPQATAWRAVWPTGDPEGAGGNFSASHLCPSISRVESSCFYHPSLLLLLLACYLFCYIIFMGA